MIVIDFTEFFQVRVDFSIFHTVSWWWCAVRNRKSFRNYQEQWRHLLFCFFELENKMSLSVLTNFLLIWTILKLNFALVQSWNFGLLETQICSKLYLWPFTSENHQNSNFLPNQIGQISNFDNFVRCCLDSSMNKI